MSEPDTPWMQLRGWLRRQLEPASKIETRVAYFAVLIAVVIGVFIVKHLIDRINETRRQGVLTSCQESNRRHVEAIPQLTGLIKNSLRTNPPAERLAEWEALRALERPTMPPRTKAGQQALAATEGFIEVIAPHYDCKARLRLFTKP